MLKKNGVLNMSTIKSTPHSAHLMQKVKFRLDEVFFKKKERRNRKKKNRQQKAMNQLENA